GQRRGRNPGPDRPPPARLAAVRPERSRRVRRRPRPAPPRPGARRVAGRQRPPPGPGTVPRRPPALRVGPDLRTPRPGPPGGPKRGPPVRLLHPGVERLAGSGEEAADHRLEGVEGEGLA